MMEALLPAGIFAPRPSIFSTQRNGRIAAENSVKARSVPARKPIRRSCRRLMREIIPPEAIEVSSCGLITSSLRRRKALVSFRQRPWRVEIHARTAERRSDDGEDDEGHDEPGKDRDHPFARSAAEESLDQHYQHHRQDQHHGDWDDVVRYELSPAREVLARELRVARPAGLDLRDRVLDGAIDLD